MEQNRTAGPRSDLAETVKLQLQRGWVPMVLAIAAAPVVCRLGTRSLVLAGVLIALLIGARRYRISIRRRPGP